MNKSYIIIMITIVLLSTIVIIESKKSAAYTEHYSIMITSNDDFITQGWQGSGTQVDPWIIEGLEINATGCEYAIHIENTTDCFVIRNCFLHEADMFSNPYGLGLINVVNAIIENNTIDSNLFHGIYLENTNNITIIGNKLSNNKIAIKITQSSSLMINNNILKNGEWGVCASYSNNINFTCNTASNNIWGIDFGHTNHSKIFNNNVNTNHQGITIRTSKENSVINNEIINNQGTGLYIGNSNNNNASNNNVIYNDGDGISIFNTSHNVFMFNNISSNMRGIFLNHNSSYNSIVNNLISYSNWSGIQLEQICDNNVIYHNDFIKNNWTTLDNTPDDCINFWDNGYPSGGNYWDDYMGVDGFFGPEQNVTGSDGIGDTQYPSKELRFNWADNYPLMHPKIMLWVDNITPISSVNLLERYWYNENILINVLASDRGGAGIDNVTFWFRYSEDNATWNDWIEQDSDFISPWIWEFSFPNNEGYYEFHSIAKDIDGNIEINPNVADIKCAYDITSPVSNLNISRRIIQGTVLILNGTDSLDNIAIDNYTWSFDYNGSTIFLYGVSPIFVFDIVGTYNITLNVTDCAGNWNSEYYIITVTKSNFIMYLIISTIIIISLFLIIGIHKRKKSSRISTTKKSNIVTRSEQGVGDSQGPAEERKGGSR